MHLARPLESHHDDLIIQPSAVSAISANRSTPDVYTSTLDVNDLVGPAENSPAYMDMSLDTRRLQAQHNTIGYREGITAGKSTTIQEGFDRGYALGANLGIKAGQVVGLLEAISAALAKGGSADEVTRVAGLLSRAAEDLTPENLFTSDFWASDGTWTYPVMAPQNGGGITYQDVAGQHPLIAKWSYIANMEAKNQSIDQSILILENVETLAQESTAPKELIKSDIPSRVAIEW